MFFLEPPRLTGGWGGLQPQHPGERRPGFHVVSARPMQPEPGSFYSFQEKSEHSDERGVKVREEGAILTREEQEGQSLVPQPNTKLEGGVAPITRPLGHAHRRERGTWDSGALGCGKGVNTDGLAASTTADCPPWGRPPPTLQLVPQRERTESSGQGCWGTKNTVC